MIKRNTISIIMLIVCALNSTYLYAQIDVVSVTYTSVDECNGAIDIIAQGTAGPFTFKWQGPTNFISNDEDIYGLCAGIYNVTITNCYNIDVFLHINVLEKQESFLKHDVYAKINVLDREVEVVSPLTTRMKEVKYIEKPPMPFDTKYRTAQVNTSFHHTYALNQKYDLNASHENYATSSSQYYPKKVKPLQSLNKYFHHEITIYPNPFTDYFDLNIESPIESAYSIIITDIGGQVYFTSNVNIITGINQIHLNSGSLDQLPSGVYIIMLKENETNFFYQTTVIKI